MHERVLKDIVISNMYASKCCYNNCIRIILPDIAVTYWKTFQQYSEKEQKLVIQTHLALCKQDIKFLKCYKTERNVDLHKTFYFWQIQICRKLYLFLHDLKHIRYKQIVVHFDKNELKPCVQELV